MNKFLKTALAILPLAVMASCSDDPMPNQNEGIAEKSETRYLQVTLKSADANPESRAPGSLEGNGSYETGEENAIKTLEFYFYTKDKQFHSYKSMNVEGNEGGGETETTLHDGKPLPDNVAAFYHCNVPVTLVQGEAYPQYVICIINSVAGTQYQSKPMSEAQASKLDFIGPQNAAGELQCFGMSNSVYYGVDAVTSKADQLIMATPFKLDALKTEEELGKMTLAEKEACAINIYVERYAVKVKLNITDVDIKDYTAGDGVTKLHFEPVSWGVNATEKQFYFLKAFRTDPSREKYENTNEEYGETYEEFADLDFLFMGWNNPDHHRCYWARTPNYYANQYPLVADDITDGDENGKDNEYPVEYISYNKSIPLDYKNGQKTDFTYTKETTLKKSRLTGEDMGDRYLPLASIPSVVLIGKYRIVGLDKEDDIDFYAYGKTDNKYNFYVDDDQKEGGGTGLANILDKMLTDQTIVLSKSTVEGKDTYTPYSSSTIGVLRDKFLVEHPSAKVRMAPTQALEGETESNGAATGVKVAADIVVLQLNEKEIEGTENLYFYNALTSRYEQITSSNAFIVNRLLLQNLGGAHLYKDGMAFFSAPIKHWGWYRKEATKPSGAKQNANPNIDKPTMDEWDWTAMETGDFGLVRNHIYTLKIGEIAGLGTAIKDSDDPIIPPADKVPYVVHFHVNIQKWAVLPTQNWNF